MKKDLIAKLTAFMEENNIRVYGINSTDRLSSAPEGFTPEAYLQNPRSFICFALPIPKGVYTLQSYKNEFVWRSQNLMYKQLDTLSLNIAGILEAAGFTAIPFYGCLPQRYNKKKEFAGHMNQIMMGSIAGIGFVGRSGMLVNDLYGPRMMLGSVLTDAPLPVRCSIEQQGTDCPPDCRVCIEKCPVQAIYPDERRVNVLKCLYYTSKVHSLPVIRFFLFRLLDPQAALRILNRTAFDDNTFHICSLCVSECPLGN